MYTLDYTPPTVTNPTGIANSEVSLESRRLSFAGDPWKLAILRMPFQGFRRIAWKLVPRTAERGVRVGLRSLAKLFSEVAQPILQPDPGDTSADSTTR